MSKEIGVPMLQWKQFGPNWFGLSGDRVFVVIAQYDPKNKNCPQPIYAVTYPDRDFVDIGAAKELAQAHKRCEDHGVYMCSCVPMGSEGG